ncbi:MAG TPA: hypothetical protein VET69_09520 [Terriglobales bacterium]|nr:hypothetical protein [Terriglobales bacterium]
MDSNVVWQETGSQPSIAQPIPVSAGQHQITATATNSTGDSGSSSVTVTLSSSAAALASTLSVSLKPIGSSSPANVTAVAQGPTRLPAGLCMWMAIL